MSASMGKYKGHGVQQRTEHGVQQRTEHGVQQTYATGAILSNLVTRSEPTIRD